MPATRQLYVLTMTDTELMALGYLIGAAQGCKKEIVQLTATYLLAPDAGQLRILTPQDARNAVDEAAQSFNMLCDKVAALVQDGA